MKYTCKINLELQEELNRKNKKKFTSMMIAGIMGLVGYVVFSMLFDEGLLLTCLLVSASILFGFGLIFRRVVDKSNKDNALKNIEDTYEIFDDHLTVESFTNGEKTVSVKTYFKDIVKIDETENYFFLYPNKLSAYPVPKKEFSPEDLEAFISKVKGLMQKKK
jgi:hypothetical protein